MQPKVYGVTDLEFRCSPNEVPTIRMEIQVEPGFNPNDFYSFTGWNDLFPGNVLIKCQYCGQWGARRTSCRHCGGEIE